MFAQASRPQSAQLPPLRLRVLRMALVWAFLGEWVGASIGMQSGGLIGAIVGTVVGMVELAALGAVLGLIGGRPLDTLLGAACGLVAGTALSGAGGGADLLFGANLGLIVGAAEGATLRPYLRTIGRTLSVLARPLAPLLLRAATTRR